MKVEYIIQREITENYWIDDDSADSFEAGVEKLDIIRDCARKSEERHKQKYRLIKRVEQVYDV